MSNIVLADDMLSDTPAAERYRAYVKEQRRIRAAYENDLACRTRTNYANVTYDAKNRLWLVRELVNAYEERSPLHIIDDQPVLSTHATLHDAEKAAAALHSARAFLADLATGKDKAPEPLPPGVGQTTAGPLGPDLSDLHARIAYDWNGGRLIWRNGPNRYQDAPIPTTGRTSYIPFLSWRLPAHAVAFLLAHGVWPTRGTISPRDGNWRNLVLSNWSYIHDAVTRYPLEPK